MSGSGFVQRYAELSFVLTIIGISIYFGSWRTLQVLEPSSKYPVMVQWTRAARRLGRWIIFLGAMNLFFAAALNVAVG